MPDFNELEVFHQILREAALAQKPPHESDAYLRLSAADKSQFDLLYLLWTKSEEYQSPIEVNPAEAFLKFRQNTTSDSTAPNESKVISIHHFWSKPILKYAAIFLVLIAATFFIGMRPNEFQGGENGLFVHLDDGSSVWIKSEAKIKVNRFFKQLRSVELEGVAFFDIASANEPFNIQTKDLEISVLGTSFTVDSKNQEISVFDGIVEVIHSNHKAVVEKFEKLLVVEGVLTTRKTDGEKPDWVNPELTFNNEKLTKVIQDLEAFFGIIITVVGNQNDSNCTFTSGSMANTSLENIFEALQLTYELEVKKTGETSYQFSNISCK